MAEPWLNRRCADVEQFRIPRRLPQDRVQSGCGAPAGTGIVPGGGEQAAQAGSPGNCPGWRSGSRAVGCAWCRSVSRPASPASPAPRGELTWSCTLTSFSSWCLTDGTVGGRRSTCMASGAPHSPIGGALDGGVQHQVQQQLQATRQLLDGAELQIAAGAHRASNSPFPLHEGGAAGQIGAALQVQADVEAGAHDLVAPLQQLQHHRHVLFSRRNTLR